MQSSETENDSSKPQQAFNTLLKICQEFDEEHQQFLQFLATRRSIEISMIGKIFLEICKETYTENKSKLKELKQIDNNQNRQIMDNLRRTLNPKLSTFGFHIAQRANEYSRTMEFWVLVSELHFSAGFLHSGILQKEEVTMFYHWIRLMFTNENDPNMEDICTASDDDIEKTSGELETTTALLYAKKNGWTMQRAQKLLDKLEKQQKWISILMANIENKLYKRKFHPHTASIIRLTPCAVAELEPLFTEMRIPVCIVCKHPVIVSRLAFKCEKCNSTYHASCILREFEFPTKCVTDDCDVELDEDILQDFVFDTDMLRLPPRRSSRASKSGSNVVLNLSNINGT